MQRCRMMHDVSMVNSKIVIWSKGQTWAAMGDPPAIVRKGWFLTCAPSTRCDIASTGSVDDLQAIFPQ